MIRVVGVKLRENGKLYYFSPNNINLKKGLTVIVNTERGLQFGYLETNIIEIEPQNLKRPLNDVVRIASRKDYLNYKTNLKDEKEAIKVCKKLVKELKLEMRVISCDFTFDRNQLQFSFLADDRVDFRELVKKLASIYKTRIELKQIGVRDKAKEVGGIGPCGQKLCCKRFLNNIDNVTINMAKEQNLSLNPAKINGACGRLLCCLKFEEKNYKKYKKNIPQVGTKVKTKQGEEVVLSTDLLLGKYKVSIPEKGIIEIDVEERVSL